VLQEPIGVIDVRHGAARQASPASGPKDWLHGRLPSGHCAIS